MLHHRQPVKFKCTACGQCCYGDAFSYIRLNKKEAQAIAAALHLTYTKFKKQYLIRLDDNGYGIELTAAGACPLLNNAGRCSVYSVRPSQCRTYPYWPEILESKKTWLAEKKRCEGINQGESVSVDYIEQQLQASIKADTEPF